MTDGQSRMLAAVKQGIRLADHLERMNQTTEYVRTIRSVARMCAYLRARGIDPSPARLIPPPSIYGYA